MNTKDTGGPAFPPMHDPNTHEFGMTLRDYFAAKAMQGFAADPGMGSISAAEIAKIAYLWADAMLKERKP